MKFPGFKQFGPRLPNLEKVVEYLRVEMNANLLELTTGLANLRFLDNFESFRVTVEIPAGAEVGIENKLRNGIPTDRLFVRANSNSVVDGDTEWTMTHVYLKNTGASSAKVTVLFFK